MAVKLDNFFKKDVVQPPFILADIYISNEIIQHHVTLSYNLPKVFAAISSFSIGVMNSLKNNH